MPRNHIKVGLRHKKLTVIRVVKKYGRGFVVECQCKCGNKIILMASVVRARVTCGCSRHGHGGNGKKRTAEYRAWAHMIGRATCPTDTAAKNYSQRGITVCERWRNSFRAFFSDMGPKPSPKHTLERINNDGNYEPTNCRWATRREQNRNRRSCIWITFNGRNLLASDWARELNIKRSTLDNRLTKMPLDIALTRPRGRWI